MLTIDRANVQMEPVPASPAGAAPSTAGGLTGASPTAPVPVMSDAEFRARVLQVLDDVLREMDRRGSR